MARVVKDPEERRVELLETAHRLFCELGYEQTSVENITQAVGIAKGTFYHYFHSKADLLKQLSDWLAEKLMDDLERQIRRMEADALEKLRFLFSFLIGWKADRRKLTMTLAKVMYREENLPLRHNMNVSNLEKVLPIFTEIIDQGTGEGVFKVKNSKATAEIILSMYLGIGERLTPLYISLDENLNNLPELIDKIKALENALERILGVEEGTLQVYDLGLLRRLFAEGERK